MADKYYFTGFSTIGTSKSRSWVLRDIELIKTDLMNHFHTRRGERRMRPTFGCIIWDYIFDQMTPEIVAIVENEARRIVEHDTRLEARNIQVQTSDHGIVIVLDLYFRPFDVTEQFRVDFESRQ